MKDPKDDKITALTTRLFKLDKKTLVLEKVQVGGGNRTQTRINTKARDPKKSYAEGLHNLESWRVNQ